MVVFVCGSCGESVKKAAVDKHCQTKCRNCQSLSCIDCGKDFPGDTFRSHNQCMTEEEKWHGKDAKVKAGGNTGQKKQDAWVESIQNAIPVAKSSNPQLADYLQKLLGYDNMPRKEAKFKNFLKNSLRIHNHQIITAIWTVVGSVKAAVPVPQPKPPAQSSTNGGSVAADSPVANGRAAGNAEVEDLVEPAKKRSKKDIPEDTPALTKATTDETEATTDETAARKFRWKKEIREVLVDSPSHSLSERKLMKKVLRRYETSLDLRAVAQDDLSQTFDKYLRKYPDLFHVEDSRVKLICT
ncbi:putative Cell growth-regulating nucleolar protein [Hypsibius exemplaris]|uniref:Cell growth-regulating nucleolar protein n=1 Tax=Hypsibius exemplaris TaxID=2072580 RepID=A0A1W0XAR2_HYPEX|nr:putative Cell growth-regulating nucleolar protein [Hypsibius exemplaris]